MRNSIGQIVILASTLMFGTTAIAAQISGDALLKECEAKAQGATDSYAAISACLDERLQYDASSGGGE